MSDQPRRNTVRLSLPDFGSQIEIETGKTVMEALRVAGLALESECGGMGAKVALTSEERLEEARRLARRIRHVELMLRQEFQARFTDHIPFPEPTPA